MENKPKDTFNPDRTSAAETEEELIETAAMAPVMKQAVQAYREIIASDEFQRLERIRADARRNEAAALGNARREERALWERVVADKDAEIEQIRADKDAALAEKDAEIERLRADKDAALAEKDAEIERLRALLEEKTKGHI